MYHSQESGPCVNLGAPDLYALYTGYSRGKDLVGGQDGWVTASEIVSPGFPVTTSYQYYEVRVCVLSCVRASMRSLLAVLTVLGSTAQSCTRSVGASP